MRRFKNLLIVSALLVAGAVIGAIGVSIQWHKVMSSFAAAALMEIAVDAREIRGGKAEATLRRKMDAIPGLVQQVDSVHQRYLPESVFNDALWAVTRFYEDTETGVPASIQSILQSIPPRPKTSCELKGICTPPEKNNEKAERNIGDDSLPLTPQR